jgi:integrase
MAAYQEGMGAQKPELGSSRTIPGTINAMAVSYYASPGYKALAPQTQRMYRNLIERLRVMVGNNRIAKLEQHHVRAIVAKNGKTPAASNNLLRGMRLLCEHAVSMGVIKTSPCLGVKKTRYKTEGFSDWSEDEIAKFEAKYPIGTRERLAFSLALFTSQRRSDLVTLGRQHLRGGVLSLRQKKTGTVVEIPVHPDLAHVLDNTPRGELTFLVTRDGKPFSAAGFTNWFRDCVREAGLPEGRSVHGLRKAACRRLAEAGATASELMSISGHLSLSEAERYTRAASKKKMAEAGMAKLVKLRP